MDDMHMAEDKAIDVGMLGSVLLGILDEWLQELHIALLAVRLTRRTTPPLPEAHKQIGMHHPREDGSQNARTEAYVHQAQKQLAFDIHIVAVSQIDGFTAKGDGLRSGIYRL